METNLNIQCDWNSLTFQAYIYIVFVFLEVKKNENFRIRASTFNDIDVLHNYHGGTAEGTKISRKNTIVEEYNSVSKSEELV